MWNIFAMVVSLNDAYQLSNQPTMAKVHKEYPGIPEIKLEI